MSANLITPDLYTNGVFIFDDNGKPYIPENDDDLIGREPKPGQLRNSAIKNKRQELRDAEAKDKILKEKNQQILKEQLAIENADRKKEIEDYKINQLNLIKEERAKMGLQDEEYKSESLLSILVRVAIKAITELIMENYINKTNIESVGRLIQDIIEEFFERLRQLGEMSKELKASIQKIKTMILQTINKEARTNIDPDNGIEMKSFSTDNNGNKMEPTGGGKRRKKYTKKRRGSKRRY